MTTDPNSLLQGHYKIKFNPTDKFNYTSIYQESVGLFLHQEVPQGYNYIEPRLSPNEKFLSVIGEGDYSDIVLIYDIDNLIEYKFIYDEKKKVFGVDFAPDSRSFIIIYKNQPSIHYNISSGKKIVSFKPNNNEKKKPIAFTFSAKCRFFGLAYDFGFYIWDTLKGDIVKEIKEESDKKIIRDNLLISIKQNLHINIRDFGNEDKVIKNLSINGENLHYDDILAMMLSPNLEYIFFGIKSGIFKMDIESGNIDKIIEFENEASSIKLSQSCKLGIYKL